MRQWQVIAGMCLLLGLTACGQANEPKQGDFKPIVKQQPPVKELTEKERKNVLSKVDTSMVEAQNELGLRLHQELSKDLTEDNLIISPYSITQALALAYNGAAGDTQTEMSDVLGWNGKNVADINEGNRHLKTLLEKGGGVTLNVANSVWYQHGILMKKPYLAAVEGSYESMVKETDLQQENAKTEINEWIKKQTNGMIPSIYDRPPGGVAVLINAIYFYGGWMDEFDPANTVDEEFTLSDGTKKKVPIMKQEQKYRYKEGETWQAVRIPYGDGRMHMLVILPKESSSLDEVHRQLWQDPSIWKEDFSYESIALGLPKFKVKQSFQLPEALHNLGMVKAFDAEAANFSEMAESGDGFYINKVTHMTVVDVSEKGTEAAAVTAVSVAESAAPPSEPIIMNINRPFFFAIEDRDTGTWLFMGSVFNP